FTSSLSFFLFHLSSHLPHPPSFPTRRSSDLNTVVKSSITIQSDDSHSANPFAGTNSFTMSVGSVTLVNMTLRSAGTHRLTAKDGDRKSTRLNSSHQIISYAVFCLKKKNKSKN